MTVNNQELVSTGCLKKKQSKAKQWNCSKVNNCLLLGIALSISLYLMVANSLATQTFTLRDHKNQLIRLQQEQVNLQNQVTLLTSYSHLQGKVQSLGMVPVDRISQAITDQDFLAKK